jgi:hypothetical protein
MADQFVKTENEEEEEDYDEMVRFPDFYHTRC